MTEDKKAKKKDKKEKPPKKGAVSDAFKKMFQSQIADIRSSGNHKPAPLDEVPEKDDEYF